jgi:NAD+ synthase
MKVDLNFTDTINKIKIFLQESFQHTQKNNAVIATSGGIDSALSLTLLAQSLPLENIYPVFLPYGDQNMNDAYLAAKFNQIPDENWQTINIKPMTDLFIDQLKINDQDSIRLGNIKARVRMICLFDFAKKINALVVGTENKSEKYLGYFTRFGDAASDLEPIEHIYKTQVRQLAKFLRIPDQLIEKAPSAELWSGQTDEQEMGFTYEAADLILEQLIDEQKKADQIDEDREIIQKVLTRVQAMAFKQQVPYTLE